MKKTIALVVVFAFLWVFTAASFPLFAQEAPGAVEKAAPSAPAVGNGGSILPWVLIGVGVVAVALVLILIVFKTTYDITGAWTINFTGGGAITRTVTFSGTKDSGTWTMASFNIIAGNSTPADLTQRAVVSQFTGTYTVDGKNVTMTQNNIANVTISGTFSDKDTMSGTWVLYGVTMQWTATRGGIVL
jgi:hypothetical protein